MKQITALILAYAGQPPPCIVTFDLLTEAASELRQMWLEAQREAYAAKQAGNDEEEWCLRREVQECRREYRRVLVWTTDIHTYPIKPPAKLKGLY